MKKIDFDVFDLISPLKSAPVITPDPLPAPAPMRQSTAFKLARAIRSSRFVLPQVELVGEQVTKGPSPVRHLQFSRYEVPDYALKKVISTLEKHEQDAIHNYLWSEVRSVYDLDSKRWTHFDPEFSDSAEQAFSKVFHLLKQLAVLRPRQRTVVDDGGTAL